MPNTREKLIELLCQATFGVNKQTIESYLPSSAIEEVVDHLIANGVTIATDNNVGDKLSPTKWIPVTERLPDTIPCSVGTAYSEAVNVLTTGRKVLTAIWDGTDFIADAEFWEAENEEITHWTPVLLPLPDPPEEGADNG